MLLPPKGLATLTEALNRVGIETGPTRLQQDYNAGRTTQVPTGRVVAVNGRVRRKIGYGGVYLSFETISEPKPPAFEGAGRSMTWRTVLDVLANQWQK
jgi:hypothetical protein